MEFHDHGLHFPNSDDHFPQSATSNSTGMDQPNDLSAVSDLPANDRVATRSEGISIKDILPECQIFGAKDIRISSCCHDWNAVQPGDLYVAKVEMEKDGHDHIGIAARKGAAAILSERFVVSDIPVCIVDDTREAYGKICQRLVGDPKDQMQIIGVTGTNGKTIVTTLLNAIFRKAEIRTGSISSNGFNDGFVNTPTSQTTPQPPQLAQQLAELVANGCEVAIVESSSRGIAERRLSGLEFDACVYTNVGRDHIDSHGTLENYRRIKTRLLDRLKPGGFAVTNSDDRFLRRWTDTLGCPTLTYGLRNSAEIMAERIEQSVHGQTFLLVAGSESIPVQVPFVGDHFVRHCLAAATVGLTMNLSLETIAAGLESVASIPGHMESVYQDRGFSLHIDSAQTPGQLREMLKSLRRASNQGRVRCLFGGVSRLSNSERAALGTVAEKYADEAIITSVDDHNGKALENAHEILDGYEQVPSARVLPNRVAAIRYLLETAQPGDKLLIAGNGDQEFRFSQEPPIAFTDRQICDAWLENPNSLNSLVSEEIDEDPICYPIDDYR